jgi:pimeloyl-ACP methyl ester carboxylesterase
MDRGYGAVGVAINSAPTEGVPVVPLSQLKSTFAVLRTLGRKKAAGFTFQQWRYAFTNTFTEEESRALYERCHIPASVLVLWGSALATLEPGHQDTFVNYHNGNRAPLLFICGGEDHLMPPSVQRSNAKHYKSNTVTEVRSTPVTPTCCPPKRAGSRSPTTRWPGPWSTHGESVPQTPIAHIGGSTSLLEVVKLRLGIDPVGRVVW